MSNIVRVAAATAFSALLIAAAVVAGPASAHEPHDGLNFSIGVRGVDGCNTRSSDVSCTLPSGQTFVVEVSLDELPDDIPSYGGFDLYATFTGVTPSQDANNDDWPDCGFPAAFVDVANGFVGWGCAMGVPPAGPSSWIGPIGTVTFTCTQNGTIALVHGSGSKTDLVEPETLEKHSEGNGEQEELTITCGTLPANTPGEVTKGTPGGPGPTAGQIHTPPAGQTTPGATLGATEAAQATGTAQAGGATTPEGTAATAEGPGGGSSDDDSSNAWIWIVVIAVVAVVVIGGGGYLYMRNRGGTPPSGGTPPAGGTPPSSGTPPAGGTPPNSGTPPAGGGSTPAT